MNFGIMFFSSAAQTETQDRYSLLKQATRFADQRNFSCVWTPERHFHDFGGLYPNPSVLSAALAMITENIQIRAGSLISPLHDPIRIVEEWSLVDNLSFGRVGISFGSGWNVDDFIFFPDRYANRQAVMYEQINKVKELWRGNSTRQINPMGKEVSLKIFPTPIQPELPIWVTSSGNMETFISAGAIGANLLTHMLGQDLTMLAEKISAYRESREKNNHDPKTGIVSLMLHTYLGSNLEEVKSEVRTPMREYLRSAVALERKAALGGGVISGGHKVSIDDIATQDLEELLDLAFERYFKTASLMGTPSSCINLVEKLSDIGVDEVACLIDFGVAHELILEGLEYLDSLRAMFSREAVSQDVQSALDEFTTDF